MEHQMLLWLLCDLDAKGTHIVSLYCAICRKYQANIQLLKNFRRDWIVGSTNQRTSNLNDHDSQTSMSTRPNSPLINLGMQVIFDQLPS